VGKKISMAQVADEAGVCVRTIRRYIASGDLKAFRLGPRAIRIDSDDLAALLRPVGNGGGGHAA
jgi:excisionase family DNA binding protein